MASVLSESITNTHLQTYNKQCRNTQQNQSTPSITHNKHHKQAPLSITRTRKPHEVHTSMHTTFFAHEVVKTQGIRAPSWPLTGMPFLEMEFIIDQAGTKRSILFCQKPLGMEFWQRQPVKVTAFKQKSHAQECHLPCVHHESHRFVCVCSVLRSSSSHESAGNSFV